MTQPMATSCYCGTCPTCTGTVTRPAVADPLVFRHGAIKQRMLARMGSIEIEKTRPLESLGTRQDDDPSIALIDAFAGSLHILAWNAARLSDDGSIRRTEDRDALVDLTRMLGYEPRPALAATTTLAFTLDNLEGSPKVATIPKGTKVASVPGQNEKPQTFETDAPLEARVGWNALKPVLKKTVPPVNAATSSITIAGASTAAKAGDLVLVYLEPQTSPVKWLCARIVSINREANPEGQPAQTRFELTSRIELTVVAVQQGDTFKNRVVVLGQHAAAFGATAPDLDLMPQAIRDLQVPPTPPTEWKNLVMSSSGTVDGGPVDLDAVYADAMQDRFILFSKGPATGVNAAGDNKIGRIASSAERSRKGFGLSAKVSRITVEGIDLSSTASSFQSKVRETTIYIETARETLLVVDADERLPTAAASDRVTVMGAVNLPAGRRVVLFGEPWTATLGQAARIGEVATLLSSSPTGGNTELVFERAITNGFHSTTLSLLANAVSASHGETPVNGPELIGSGNASIATLRFQLKGSPLTYVPATNPRGYAPAIEVRVGDRLYAEKSTIFGLSSADRAYTVKTVRDGKSEVQFAGRLPSGTLNVSALYRTGGGKAGNLSAGRITTAMAPVLGVGGGRNPVPGIGITGVSNPVPAEGASEAETVEDMRSAAPQSVRTLDRVVSLADFEAFTKSYRGIGKAMATELHMGLRSVVCITIATSSLTSPLPGSDIIESLRKELTRVTVPGRSIRIEGFTDLTAQITVALVIDPAFRRSDVEAAVRARLAIAFGREARRFGEALHRSTILAAVQKVEGVVAAKLTAFTLPGGPPESEGRLFCPVAQISAGVFTKAGLLSIDPTAIQFEVMLP